MSNEYKDWLWDHIQDLAFERGLVDTITKVQPQDPSLGRIRFIYGLKNNQPVKYEVLYDEIEGYKYEHRELERERNDINA